MTDRFQQVVQYNQARLPRTMAALRALQPDISTDPELRYRLRCELTKLYRQLDACSHLIYSDITSKVAPESWTKFQLHPNWAVMACRLGPSLWLIPLSDTCSAFWDTRKSKKVE